MRSVWSGVIGLVVGLLWSSSAAAFEDKVSLGAGAGYAVWPGLNAAHGLALDLHAGIGLTQAWQARAGASYAAHPHGADVLSFHTLGARAELVYLVDIIDIVPFAGLGVSGIALLSPHKTELEPAAHVIAGAAYWLSFDWLLQLDVRAHVMPGRLGDTPIYLASTLSVVVALDR